MTFLRQVRVLVKFAVEHQGFTETNLKRRPQSVNRKLERKSDDMQERMSREPSVSCPSLHEQ